MMLPPLGVDVKDIKEKLSSRLRPWQRSFQFWVRAVDIYAGYKVGSVPLSQSSYQIALHSFIGTTCHAGVSSESEFRERCAEAGSNVGNTARACCRQDLRYVHRPWRFLPQGFLFHSSIFTIFYFL